ncbi:hypothetical protein L3Q82_003576 [Scortum barcoo]|uniref:Uncharacterized protein n=1 Tax=Scortum barcoo TaxID=214431 RepID=A0ACB8VNF4_9TELE|nr:hypothetical protein L3Q82_003576 [Scortum barcoo]
MVNMRLSARCQIGLDFFEFLQETHRASVRDRLELRDIYNTEFRGRNPEGKDPNFGSVLYALKVCNKIKRRGDDIRFSPMVTALYQDQWHSPRGRQPEPVQNGADSPGTAQAFTSGDGAETGVRGRRKLASLLMNRLRTDRAGFISDKHGVSITSDRHFENGKLCLRVEEFECIVNLNVENTGTEPVYFTYYTPLHWLRDFTLNDEFKVTKTNPLHLQPGDSYEIQLHFRTSLVGFYPATLAFEFKPDLHSAAFYIVRFIEAHYTTSLGRELAPIAPYKPRSLPAWTPEDDVTIVDGQPPEGLSVMQLNNVAPLNQYRIPTYMNQLLTMLKNSFSNPRINLLKSPLTWENYSEKFHLLLYLEELQMEVDIRRYNIPNNDRKHAVMTRDWVNKKLLVLEVPGVSENRPSVLRGDSLLVFPVGETKVKYRGYVHSVQLDSVKLGFSSKLMDVFIDGMEFSVQFTINRVTLRLQHRAADLAATYRLGEVLFPAAPTFSQQTEVLPLSSDFVLLFLYRPVNRLFDLKLEKNPEQYQAVQHIVAGSSKPAPYLVFGPPGTGKTVTLVEAIKQIEKTQTSCHILACAPSNSAADLLCRKILDHVDKCKVYRMYASSRDPKYVPEELKECSNLVGECYVFPAKEKLMEYKIMVTTLLTAGRLVTGNIPAGHFTHVFVDEAGHAVETECLVPLAGLLNVTSGQVVLAGDPKQLGPILRSPFALKYGMGLSLLERLMTDFPLYLKNEGVFNNRFVTKLLHNYRSHPAILKIPNELFYDGELQVSADEMLRNSYCRWEYLPKMGFPVIFHGVTGVDEREASSPSFFNIAEVELLMDYVRKLLQSHGKRGLATISPKDIGIIAPYRKQVQKIRKALEKVGKELKVMSINSLKVGSVEEFQGQERRVIMVSTVRSSPNYAEIDQQFNLGFVKNEKRFNVAVTRAKALLIVVGNPRVLNTDPTWARFIQYCRDEGGYTGFLPAEEEEDVVARLAALFISIEADGDHSHIFTVIMETAESGVQQHLDPEWRNDLNAGRSASNLGSVLYVLKMSSRAARRRDRSSTALTSGGEAEAGAQAPWQPPSLLKNKMMAERQPAEQLRNVVPLKTYQMPPYMNQLIESLKRSLANERQDPLVSKEKVLLESPLSWENYSKKFKLLLHLEELSQMEVDVRRYNIPNKDRKHAVMSRDPGDSKLLILEVLMQYDEKNKTRLLDIIADGVEFNVEFTVNRLTLLLQHRAAELAVTCRLGKVLFPVAPALSKQTEPPGLSLSESKMKKNPEQYQAVKHIVAGSSKPAPYLVFGPPGTGKTLTLVEAIKQIEKTQASCHILACAPCNSAADLLCRKILDHVDKRKVYRMYAGSRDPKCVPEELKECSNLVGDCYNFPAKEKLMEYKIMVTTLFSAGRLVTGNIPAGHFTHVFVDGAGHTTETECLIPLAGLLDAKAGQVVLAGNPKNLGPIVRSPHALKYGLGVSLLERLLTDFPLYFNNEGAFNSRFVIRLMTNYRSHPAILKIPNKLFYDGELQVSKRKKIADKIFRNSYSKWEHLPMKGFPVIFHGVTGVDAREAGSHSTFNEAEVVVLMDYMEKLLEKHGKKGLTKISPKDIGIITPYKTQAQKIRTALRKLGRYLKVEDMNDLKVASVEEFQGQERRVIMVSTVESSPSDLGFFKNDKRFHLAVTRAVALLIVVGNPEVLNKDPTWKQFIKYCQDEGGYASGLPAEEDKKPELRKKPRGKEEVETEIMSEIMFNVSQSVGVDFFEFLQKTRRASIRDRLELRDIYNTEFRDRNPEIRYPNFGSVLYALRVCKKITREGDDIYFNSPTDALLTNELNVVQLITLFMSPWHPHRGRQPFRKGAANPSPALECLLVMQPENGKKLKGYPFPRNKDMNQLIESLRKNISDERSDLVRNPLNWENYYKKFLLLLYLEEFQMKKYIKSYNIPNRERKYAVMTRDPVNRKHLVLEVPGVSENRPSVLRGDSLLVCPAGETRRYRGWVHSVQQDRVKLDFSSELLDIFFDGMEFSVEFILNRLTLLLQHRAAELAVKCRLGEVLFPAAPVFSQPIKLHRLSLFDLKLEKNPEQYQAVQHIVAGSSKPAPYLVFGPPGTGKTVTLVEAIKQIEKTQASCHILVCAPCNSAADLLCSKIVVHVDKRKVYRMYAKNVDPKCVPEDLKVCSNLVGEDYVFPDKEKLMEYKIMVTTLLTAGRLVTQDIPEGHYTHVFVDEAGHAVEPECVIALAGLLDAKTGQVVLAGDPKQLGPIVRSPFALKYGMGVSLLERLMTDFPLYWKNDGAFNNRFVTKLLHNYRSHPAILKIPNELFYDGELQVQKIRKALEEVGKELKAVDLNDLKVGSVEEFQGQERRVIMVSTVRSSPKYAKTDQKFNLGFVKNEKRFNVAVTRAKALLIVVGNPQVLSTDPTWARFIQYCREEGGYKEDDDMAARLAGLYIENNGDQPVCQSFIFSCGISASVK